MSFYGFQPLPEAQADLTLPLRHYTESSLAVSRDDNFVAIALKDSLQLHKLARGSVRRLKIPDQMNFYQHLASQRRFDSAVPTPALSSREAAQEARNESIVIDRRLNFSPTGDKLVVCTQLNDHYCYIDVYDCRTDPCVTITRNPRSLKLPPVSSIHRNSKLF